MLKTIMFISTLLVIVAHCGCSRQIDWSPDVSKLKEMRKDGSPLDPNFIESVTTFYDFLREKQWDKTYECRTQVFKKNVSKTLYKKGMDDDGGEWKLANYKINSVDVFGNDKIRLIIELFEIDGHGLVHSYSVVWWKNEDGRWRCEEEGPIKLSFSRRVVPPEN